MPCQDARLHQRYEHARLAVSTLRAGVRDARNRGTIDVRAEIELALNEGRIAACRWLLGLSPATPVTSVPAAASPSAVRRELRAAILRAGDASGNVEIPDSYEVDARWADGVSDILRQQLVPCD